MPAQRQARTRPRAPRSRLLSDPQYMRSVERLLSERREFEAVTPAMLDSAARVTDKDVDGTVTLWDSANAGTDAQGLLNAATWEGPWDGE